MCANFGVCQVLSIPLFFFGQSVCWFLLDLGAEGCLDASFPNFSVFFLDGFLVYPGIYAWAVPILVSC